MANTPTPPSTTPTAMVLYAIADELRASIEASRKPWWRRLIEQTKAAR